MNTKNPIFDELELIAPTLIDVPRTVLYSLESGYFENLSTNILNRIKAKNQIESSIPLLERKVIPTNYSIPKGYFDDFAANIMVKIKAEKDDFVRMIPIVPINPYQVSGDYFGKLANQIFEKIINTEENKILFSENLNKITPYQIPSSYFDELAFEILNKAKGLDVAEAEQNISFTKTNPYQIPVGYFNSLASQILSRISEFTSEEEQQIHFTKTNPYTIPFGYFNNLSNEILNKLKEVNDGKKENGHFTKTNPYQVPVGYFEGFPNEMLLRVNTSVEKDVPAGYFDSLPTILLQKVRGLEVKEELDEIAPLLNTVNKKPINHVPAGYFETLEPTLSKAAPAKVTGIKKKVNWFKNAIAACLIGTLSFTAYQLMDNAKPITTIQTASNEEIEIKIPTANINVDEELSKVDDASLKSYLDNIEMPTEQATAHFNDVNSGDVDEALQDISDETIQQHLDETGGLSNKKN